MDPNELLNMILDRARVVREFGDCEGAAEEARELAEYVEALDAWMRKGGFLPDAWEENREPRIKRTPVTS